MFQEMLENVRGKCPLIHNITNYVTVNDCANIVLACGASPIMSDDQSEVEEITTICGGLNINIGTLNKRTIESMLLAGKRANALNHPAVHDPVDGKKAYCIRNGHPMMSSITGTGCQLSAMTAAYVTANPEHPLEAAAAAVCAMGLAGEIAHARLSAQDGNSTYRNYIIDAIYNMTPEQLEEGAKYEVR